MLQFINANYSGVRKNNYNDANNIVDKNRNDNSFSMPYDNCAKIATNCSSMFVTPLANPFANNMTFASS